MQKIEEFEAFSMVNTNNLDKLKKSTAANPEFLVEIIDSFFEDAQELIDEMQNAIENNDFDSYGGAVHSLKGLAGTMGFTRMFELLKHMDSHNKEKVFDNSIELMPYLKKVNSDLQAELKKML